MFFYIVKAVGASVRIFQLLDRVSEINDGDLVMETLKGGMYVYVNMWVDMFLCYYDLL